MDKQFFKICVLWLDLPGFINLCLDRQAFSAHPRRTTSSSNEISK